MILKYHNKYKYVLMSRKAKNNHKGKEVRKREREKVRKCRRS